MVELYGIGVDGHSEYATALKTIGGFLGGGLNFSTLD